MSRGLGKVESTILDICQDCLTLKDRMTQTEKDYKLNIYPGGSRKFSNGEYSRVIQTVDGIRKDIPETIIDLREAAYYYHRSFNKRRKYVEYDLSRQASFSRSVRSLEKKGYIIRAPINQRQLRFIELKS